MAKIQIALFLLLVILSFVFLFFYCIAFLLNVLAFLYTSTVQHSYFYAINSAYIMVVGQTLRQN